ncbi:hypothetical protein PGT21_011892 [Puccinia graminis f. sp. tritici]|uniref:Uncharacterized protein n=1 Tax=Puccinia graminis f. sp. tritici TaxID=56615 RepID=A0A5B0M4G6_PUCGR|nr:hypothetical protein PGT21_011892 [Puccinia graminis f. sp. tritici]KAA1070898.1 hypothetical protein PGTUg99_009130 [Puccinia graminis f. sp. tritici]
MSYTIIQAHSKDQHNPRKKPKTKSNSTTVATKDAPDRKFLSEIESRHNYFPLISFLLSGTRGIFISTRDYQQYSISHCLKVLSIFKRIISSSQGPSSAHEAVWVNLGSYIRQILDLALLVLVGERQNSAIVRTRWQLSGFVGNHQDLSKIVRTRQKLSGLVGSCQISSGLIEARQDSSIHTRTRQSHILGLDWTLLSSLHSPQPPAIMYFLDQLSGALIGCLQPQSVV